MKKHCPHNSIGKVFKKKTSDDNGKNQVEALQSLDLNN